MANFTILVLNEVLPIGKHIGIDLDFESSFSSDIEKEACDLPNLVISDAEFDNKVIYNDKEYVVNKPVSKFIGNQIRKKCEDDFFGLYNTTDTLKFNEPIDMQGDSLEIRYNVKKKTVDIEKTDVIIIIDNENSQVSNEVLINQIFDSVKADVRLLITKNSDLLSLTNCNVELLT